MKYLHCTVGIIRQHYFVPKYYVVYEGLHGPFCMAMVTLMNTVCIMLTCITGTGL